MASLAGLLKESGHRVTGSDNNIYPPMSTLLTQAGIEIKPGYRKENISKDIDLVIIGNAVSRKNEEVKAVLEANLPYTSFPEALSRFFLEGRKSLVVAGTHGKTTTTALLSWVLNSAGKKPGFMVGGWMKNFDNNHQVPGGDFFVTEGDEYDTAFFDKEPKFLHYRPYASILTGIEFDHADIYRDLGHFKSSFKKYVEIIDPGGFLLVEFSDRNIPDILAHVSCPVETYGEDDRADWQWTAYRREDHGGRFALRHKGENIGEYFIPMIGSHNAENAAAAAALTLKLGLTREEIAEGFRTFKGIKKRQEVVGEKNGIEIIDDFAHHPTAIERTVHAVKEAYPGRRVWAIFEPRSATSKRNIFQDLLPQSFKDADLVVIAGLFSPDKIKPEERLDPESVVESIRKEGRTAYFISEAGSIIDLVTRESRPGDVILIMSSGGFDGIHQKLLDRL